MDIQQLTRRSLLAGLAACTTIGSARASGTPSRLPGSFIVTLGTAGGPRPRPDRSQSANLLVVRNKPYLIDCGEGTLGQIARSGLSFENIDQLFITHNHSDHNLGVPALVATMWEFQRRTPLSIRGPQGTQSFIASVLDALAVNTEIRSAEGFPAPLAPTVEAHDLVSPHAAQVYKDARVSVRAVANSHYNFPVESAPYGRHQSLSYRFDTEGGSVVFTGDTGPSKALEILTRGADTLVTEISDPQELVTLYERRGLWQRKTPEEQAAWLKHQQVEHLTPEAVAALAASAGVRRVILTHFPPSATDGDDFQRRVRAVKSGFAGKVLAARDLDRFSISL